MKEIDEFEYIQRWEYSKFVSGPGTILPKEMTLGPELEAKVKRIIAESPLARRAAGLLLRRGKPVSNSTPKHLFEINAQYQTNFGFLLVIDEGSLESSLRLPFGRLVWNGLRVGINYRSMDEKTYEVLYIRTRGFRFLREKARVENYDVEIVSPVCSTRIVDDHSIQITLRDGAVYQVSVMDNAKKGRMYNWFAALFRRQYPAFVLPSHIRAKRLRRGRKLVVSW